MGHMIGITDSIGKMMLIAIQCNPPKDEADCDIESLGPL